MKRNSSKKQNYDDLLDDTELWETRQLGASLKHAKPISKREDKLLDDSLGLQAITIRLQKELVAQLKVLAKKEGLSYQPFVRQILTRYVNSAIASSTVRKSD